MHFAIGIVTVPLASVPMKKLLSDSEITIVRDIIKLKRKSQQVVEPADSTLAGETLLSTTTEDEGPEAFDTEDAVNTAESSTETMSEVTTTTDDVERVTLIDFFVKDNKPIMN